ncbi:recombinase family protein [candidate division BRC1 bacterium HGW-BRC1-1]|jgi:site-specific DNA recombinase|nr:MAG: recombinase family protein [candidate division BRC1 bacterium HGW-BRC1-1]
MTANTRHDGDSKRVGIWIRVSTEDQARGESPEHHEKRAHYYAESKGWQVVEVYHLEGVSGKSVIAQTETQRMLEDIRRGRITGLIFSKLARLARNTRELLDFAEHFEKHNAHLISLQESIDTSTPAGRFFYTMIAAMAQWEREEIAERVAASVPIRAKLGKPLGGQAPFGYKWEDRKLVPDPKEAPVRKLMYELFLEHRRKKTVSRLLNEAGYRTRNGSEFSDTTVERLIRDPLAKGLRRANYTRSLGNKKHWVTKPESDWVHSEVEPIISEALWEQCNHLLDERRAKGKRLGRRPVQLFAGLTRCACGQKMYVPSNSPKYICQKCRNKIAVVDLENVFYDQLQDFFQSPVDVAEYLKTGDETVREKEELLRVLEQEHGRISKEMDIVYRTYIDGQMTGEGFGKRYRPLEDRVKQLDDEIPRLQAEIDFLRIHYLSSDQVLHEAQDLWKEWPRLDQDEKRKIVENITEAIVIGNGEITIDLSYLPSASEVMAKRQHNVMGSCCRRG